jgi:hypothetical protein
VDDTKRELKKLDVNNLFSLNNHFIITYWMFQTFEGLNSDNNNDPNSVY